jgi:hypothetical protein
MESWSTVGKEQCRQCSGKVFDVDERDSGVLRSWELNGLDPAKIARDVIT